MKHILKLMAFLLSFLSFQLNARVLVITHSYNRPDFIEIQHNTLKKFMLDEYEFVVFNDAYDQNIRTQINQMCAKHTLTCIEIPQEIHDRPYLKREVHDERNHPSVRSANVLQYSLDILGFDYPGIVMVLDSDMFLIRELSPTAYLANYDIAAVPQMRKDDNQTIDYIWIGLLFLNMNTLSNKQTLSFNCGWVDGVLTDTGGYTYYYFKQNPTVRVKDINTAYLKDFWCSECMQDSYLKKCTHAHIMQSQNLSEPLLYVAHHDKDSIMETYATHSFLHYRAGSNWNNQTLEYHQKKTGLLQDFIRELLLTAS